MRFVLASSGINVKAVADKVIELVGKPAKDISCAVILEATANSMNDKRWQINGLTELAETIGGKISILNLQVLSHDEVKKGLADVDFIYCFGGDTDYLKSIFDKTGFGDLLPELLKTKVWLGNSAGSMVMCNRRIEQDKYTLEKAGKLYGVKDYYAFADCNLYVHTGSDDHPRHKLETAIGESMKVNRPVYALSDDSALVIDGDEHYMIGKDCWKIENGEIKEVR